MVEQMLECSKSMRELCLAILADLDKVEKLNAWYAAAKRVRSNSLKLEKVGLAFRKSSVVATHKAQEIKKSDND